MAERKTDFRWESNGTYPQHPSVWCDLNKADIERVEGVRRASPNGDGSYYLTIDLRYSEYDIKAELMSKAGVEDLTWIWGLTAAIALMLLVIAVGLIIADSFICWTGWGYGCPTG